MNFILPFQIPKATQTIGYHQKILCIGSCFAEEIGKLLQQNKFEVLLNPNGILFNSISIAEAIKSYIHQKYVQESELVFENNLWHSLKHHGCFSNADSVKCVEKINEEISLAHHFLKEAGWLCITLGSSLAYRYLPTDNMVANCHKIPQNKFRKVLLDSGKQTEELQEWIKQLKSFNPDLKILFSVSPVKYIRDGIMENTLSKAHLLTTVHTLCSKNENCFYFPAFELVTDVLRDYRFYKEDMVHPNEQAIKYVWEQFIGSYLASHDLPLFEEISGWVKFAAHKPINESELKSHNQRVTAQRIQIEAKLLAGKSHPRD